MQQLYVSTTVSLSLDCLKCVYKSPVEGLTPIRAHKDAPHCSIEINFQCDQVTSYQAHLPTHQPVRILNDSKTPLWRQDRIEESQQVLKENWLLLSQASNAVSYSLCDFNMRQEAIARKDKIPKTRRHLQSEGKNTKKTPIGHILYTNTEHISWIQTMCMRANTKYMVWGWKIRTQ